MRIEHKDIIYELITNYTLGRLMEKCRDDYDSDVIQGGMFVEWLIENEYIAPIFMKQYGYEKKYLAEEIDENEIVDDDFFN